MEQLRPCSCSSWESQPPCRNKPVHRTKMRPDRPYVLHTCTQPLVLTPLSLDASQPSTSQGAIARFFLGRHGENRCLLLRNHLSSGYTMPSHFTKFFLNSWVVLWPMPLAQTLTESLLKTFASSPFPNHIHLYPRGQIIVTAHMY